MRTRRGVLCVLALALAAHAQGRGRFDGLRRDESRFRDRGSWERLGLYIGIDDYPRVEGGDLQGCVNDVEAIRDVLRTRFRVERYALLRNEQATRKGILAKWRELADLVTKARAELPADRKVSVVVAYAGHGGRVADESKDEDDAMDETWAAHDSTLADGENDVLDDEIQSLALDLVRRGAEVVLISDSCHSGTVHRTADFARARGLKRGDRLRGAPRSLFPGFKGADTSHYVHFAACKDRQRAREDGDHGRFTKSFVHALRSLPRATTYGELHARVAAHFARRWGDGMQTPEQHGKTDGVFLLGRPAPDHARMIEAGGTRVVVDRGRVHGVAPGSSFEFYADVARLEARRQRLAAGVAKEVHPLATVVVLEEAVELPRDAKARLVDVRIVDFGVRADPGLPPPLLAELERMAEHRQIRLAGPEEPFTVALAHAPGKVSFFSPDALPGKGEPPAVGKPIVYDDPANGARLLSSNLLYHAQRHQLLNLECNEDLLEVAIEQVKAKRALVDGVARLRAGDRFKLVVRNRTDRELHLSVFVFVAHGTPWRIGDVALVSPEAGRPPVKVAPGTEFVAFHVTLRSVPEPERTIVKIVATDQPVRARLLLSAPPETGHRKLAAKLAQAKGRDVSDPAFGLLRDILHGGPKLRSGPAAARGTFLATGSVVYDVE